MYHEVGHKKPLFLVNPEIIHLHNINKYTFSLLFALRGYKVVQTVHDYSLICPTIWNVHNDLKPCPTGITRFCFWDHKRGNNIFVYLSVLYFNFKRNKFQTNKNEISNLKFLFYINKINQYRSPCY